MNANVSKYLYREASPSVSTIGTLMGGSFLLSSVAESLADVGLLWLGAILLIYGADTITAAEE